MELLAHILLYHIISKISTRKRHFCEVLRKVHVFRKRMNFFMKNHEKTRLEQKILRS